MPVAASRAMVVTAAAGLVVSLWLPWLTTHMVCVTSPCNDLSVNGWEAFRWFDAGLVLLAIVAVPLAWLPSAAGPVIALVGVLAGSGAVYAIDHPVVPQPAATSGIGWFVALVAAGTLVVAGLSMDGSG